MEVGDTVGEAPTIGFTRLGSRPRQVHNEANADGALMVMVYHQPAS